MGELAENNIIAQLKLREEINWEYETLIHTVNDTAKNLREKLLKRHVNNEQYCFNKDEFSELMDIVYNLCDSELSNLNSRTKDSIKDIKYKKSILKILKA